MSYRCFVKRRKHCAYYDPKTRTCERPGRPASEVNGSSHGIKITGCGPNFKPKPENGGDPHA